MEIKLIVVDVDGTLLNSQHELTGLTQATVLALQQRGIKFTLATGKIFPAIVSIIHALDLNQPLILANGALVQQVNGKIISEIPLPRQHLLPLIDFLFASGLDYALYTADQVFVPHHSYNTTLVVEYDDPQPIEIGKIELTDTTFYKLVVLDRQGVAQLDFFGSELNKKFEGILKAHRSVPGMLEVFNAETSKSVAVRAIAAHLGLGLSEVMVVGDSYNDIDMFQVAGLAVAMGNAPELVRQAVHITIGTNDEDGLARYISSAFDLGIM